MIAPEASLIRENDREMYFAHRPLTGAVFMLISMGLVYYFSFSGTVEDKFARWIFTAVGAFFTFIGLGSTLWRYELRLDLLTRTYSGRKGFWPNPMPFRGLLDEMEGVILASRKDRSGNNAVTVWTVSFGFRTRNELFKVMESRSEAEARRKLEHFAMKLRIPAIDRTGAGAERTSGSDPERAARP